MNPSIIENFLTPINASSPTGQDARYEPCYEIMENEVKKFGSLFGIGVDWDIVQSSTSEVLRLHSKDLKSACYFVRARLHQNGTEGLEEGLILLLALITRFGGALHPQRLRAREGAIEWLDHQLELALPKMDATPIFLSALPRYRDAIKQIQDALTDVFPEQKKSFDKVCRVIDKLLEKTSNQTEDAFLETIQEGVKQEKQAHVLASTKVKRKDEKKPCIKKETLISSDSEEALKALAKSILSSNPSKAISYYLHRYFIWRDIEKKPPHKDNISILNCPIPLNCITDFLEHAKQGADIEMLQELELSLQRTPFWFTGHYLVYAFLEQLGHHNAASTVAEETRTFVASQPGIEHLSFKNQIPFADEVTKRWLTSPSTQIVGSLNEDETESEDEENLTLENVGAYMAGLAKDFGSQHSERSQFYLHLKIVSVFLHLGLMHLSLPYLESAWRMNKEIKLESWEPDLFMSMIQSTEKTLKALYPTQEALPLKYQDWTFFYS